MKILILGSRGYLGSYLKKYLKKYKKFKLLSDFSKNNKINFTNTYELEKLLLKSKPQVIINCSGITNIDICEKKKKLSNDINVNFIKNIFLLKDKNNLNFKLIHFSSDQLYNNKIQKRNRENVFPFQKNTYSKQKYEGEKICQNYNSLVFRINLIGKSHSKKSSFTDWIFNNLNQNKIFYGFVDSIYSPISLKSISKVIRYLLKKEILNSYGVFNLGSAGSISKYKLIINFARLLNYDVKKKIIQEKINKICITRRSNYNHMNISKFQKYFKIKLPKLKDEINLVANEYKKNQF